MTQDPKEQSLSESHLPNPYFNPSSFATVSKSKPSNSKDLKGTGEDLIVMHLILRSEGLMEARKKRKQHKQHLLSWTCVSAIGPASALLQYDYRLCSLKVPMVEGKEIQSLPSTGQPTGEDTASIILHLLEVKERGK